MNPDVDEIVYSGGGQRGNSTMLLSCRSAFGNSFRENLPLSEIHLGLVFPTPTLFSITVVWKWIFRQTKISDLQIKALDFCTRGNYLANQPESRAGFM